MKGKFNTFLDQNKYKKISVNRAVAEIVKRY